MTLAFGVSRLLVWVTGVAAVVASTFVVPEVLADTVRVAPYGDLRDELIAPFARWDSVHYLAIADNGYAVESDRAFFPLYPLLIAAVGTVLGSDLLAGIVVSLACLYAALAVIRRLAELELGPAVADRTVLLVAFAPLAVFLSAIYTEALFLALTAGAFYAARTDRWALAAGLGALGAATRSSGVLLLVPLAVLWSASPQRRLRDAAWLALVPAGVGAYALHLGLAHDDPLGMFGAQDPRPLRFFAIGLADGVAQGLSDLVDAARVDGVGVSHNAEQLPWLAFAVIAAVGVARRLPPAYVAWVLAGLALPLSFPFEDAPLTSLGRFVLVLFPVWIWLAAWSLESRRRSVLVLAASVVGLCFYTARFARWGFVG